MHKSAGGLADQEFNEFAAQPADGDTASTRATATRAKTEALLPALKPCPQGWGGAAKAVRASADATAGIIHAHAGRTWSGRSRHPL